MIKTLLSISVAAFLLVGCAHPIAPQPDLTALKPVDSAQRSTKVVAYYISPEQREESVTTPGGGGDKVSFHPYKDMETGLYKMLSNVFADVVVLKSPNDTATLQAKSVAFIIKPTLKDDSNSSSAFTWPPTHFSTELTCAVTDAAGKPVVTKTVKGQGNAEYAEFKQDLPLSGRRANLDALQQMETLLANTPELH